MTNQEKKLELLTALAKLPPQELAKLQVMAERARVHKLAKAEAQRLKKGGAPKRTGAYGPLWGTPLNPKQ